MSLFLGMVKNEKHSFLCGFSVACEGEDKFAVASEGKLTFLTEALPESKMNFSKRSVEKLNILLFYKIFK